MTPTRSARQAVAIASAVLGVIGVSLLAPILRSAGAAWPVHPWVLQGPCAIVGTVLGAMTLRSHRRDPLPQWARRTALFGAVSSGVALIAWAAILVYVMPSSGSQPFVVGAIAPR